MNWMIVGDEDENFEYAALLKDKIFFDFKIRNKKSIFSIGDIFYGQIDQYFPRLNAYRVILPQNSVAHLPDSSRKKHYKSGDYILVEIRSLAYADKDILLSSKTNPKETDLSTSNKKQIEKVFSAASLTEIIFQKYQHLEPKLSDNNFDHYDLWPRIENLKQGKLSLKNGVSIVIDTTTALTAIDVNSIGQVSATKANIIASEAIIQQIRLRNISGIIIIDFINMKEKADRIGLKEKIKKITCYDIYPFHIHGFTRLNLFELSRKRKGNSISEIIGQTN